MVSISESEICDVVHLVDIQSLVTHYRKSISLYNVPEADPGFQVRGSALKEIAPSGGRREIFWVFRVKNHDLRQKILFFPIIGGACAGCAPLPGSAPAHCFYSCVLSLWILCDSDRPYQY